MPSAPPHPSSMPGAPSSHEAPVAPVAPEANIATIPKILPHERVFPIQIGGELFKLSGASLSSDAPSYFSQYFRCQLERAKQNGQDGAMTATRTLYIDRDPVTFRDIALHLQGYHIHPRDSTHFVRLFADAQFYNLPKLISQLYEDHIFVSVGGREFQISRSLFTDPGNSPNFFTLGFSFFQPSDNIFPGLDRDSLLRPPSIVPPSVPNRSADNFAEIIQMLRGYGIEIRSDEHRHSLLQDCRYFLFKGLEQRLIPHKREYNQARGRDEVVLRLADIMKSGISIVPDPAAPPTQPPNASTATPVRVVSSSNGTPELWRSGGLLQSGGWVHYSRPYIDSGPAELVVETGGESSRLHFCGDGVVRVEFFNETRVRIARLFEVIATKMNLAPTTQPLGLLMASGGAGCQPPTPGNTPLSDGDQVHVGITAETSIQLDGGPFIWSGISGLPAAQAAPGPNGEAEIGPRKRRRTQPNPGADPTLGAPGRPATSSAAVGQEWIVKNAHWRLRIQASARGRRQVECVMMAAKIDASSSERSRNATKRFLGGTPTFG